LQKLITEGVESGISNQSADDLLKVTREQAMAAARDHAV
jgi:hypothetical protein